MPINKKIYIYKDTHLPEKGWFQGCFKCDSITAKTFLFDTFHIDDYLYEFIIYTCPSCTKKFDKDVGLSEEYNDLCSAYIRNHYEDLFTS